MWILTNQQAAWQSNAMVKSAMKSIYIAGFSFLSDIVYNLVQITTNG